MTDFILTYLITYGTAFLLVLVLAIVCTGALCFLLGLLRALLWIISDMRAQK